MSATSVNQSSSDAKSEPIVLYIVPDERASADRAQIIPKVLELQQVARYAVFTGSNIDNAMATGSVAKDQVVFIIVSPRAENRPKIEADIQSKWCVPARDAMKIPISIAPIIVIYKLIHDEKCGPFSTSCEKCKFPALPCGSATQ